MLEFEWDPRKARANQRKHGVSFEEATDVFSDNLSSTASDPDHSEGELRFVIFGRTKTDRYLVVGFTERDDRIRLISARLMMPSERQAYESKG